MHNMSIYAGIHAQAHVQVSYLSNKSPVPVILIHSFLWYVNSVSAKLHETSLMLPQQDLIYPNLRCIITHCIFKSGSIKNMYS